MINSGVTLTARTPQVSIILINWRGLEDTVDCVESLKLLDYPNVKIIIVDNASGLEHVEELRNRYSGCAHFVENSENYGFAGGFITGMRYAMRSGTDYIILLHNDTVVKRDAVDRLIEVAKTHPEIGLLSPSIYSYETPTKAERAAEKVEWGGLRSVPLAPQSGEPFIECDYVFPICMLIREKLIKESDMMQTMEHYFLYGDLMWSLLILRSGFKLAQVPGAVIWHKGSRSLRRAVNLNRLKWWLHDNAVLRYQIFTKNFFQGLSRPQMIYFTLFLILYQPLWHSLWHFISLLRGITSEQKQGDRVRTQRGK